MLRKFHEAAIDSADRIEALSIQKFIMKRVLQGQYDKSVLDEMQIPDSPDFAGLAMNDIWLRYKLGIGFFCIIANDLKADGNAILHIRR